MPDIWFPYLGIAIEHLNKVAFTIFGIDIAWYGVIIACGVVAGLLLGRILAKKSGQDPDLYIDFLIYALIFSLIGARIYYVIFSWDQYADNPLRVFDFRSGGLAIYGGVIGAILTAFVFCKAKKYSMLQLLDTAMPGLALGQAIGRWGNFFNQECFGTYTDNIFAMRLNIETAAYTTQELLKESISKGGVRYIQVHPMFLYESFWCLMLTIVLVLFFRKKKFHGQILFTYMIGYGLGRAWIETLRTDQLLFWNTNFPVSVLVSILMVIVGIILIIAFARKDKIAKERAAITENEYAPDIESSAETDALDDLAQSLAEESSEEEEEAEESADEETDEESAEEESPAEENDEEAEEETEEVEEKEQEKKKPEITDEDLWG
ncbi:MAG: prolipoprotein diacylglyceryl transferase [Firmicutes bacterium]|nr:prolipoprotein diacylglyceryl transferase [Bacillota bacterium]